MLLALFRVGFFFRASGFMGDTLAARVNVLMLMVLFKGILKERDPVNLWNGINLKSSVG